MVKKLLSHGESVVGFDNLNSYYDLNLKYSRLKNIQESLSEHSGNWVFKKSSLEDEVALNNIFSEYKPKVVVNLAAQAGVRYSIENPSAYIQSNLVGFGNLLEACRKFNVENLIYASSSSVYGGNRNLPFTENQSVNHPVSLYAATKKANELMAHSYSSLYNISSTGLRFFTVYGPWGRPDMAPIIFAKSIINKQPIRVFNYGKMQRDFTYIDDIVEGVFRCCYKPAIANNKFDPLSPDPSISYAPHQIFNIGNSQPINLLTFIEILEKELGEKALINFEPMQEGDVEKTAADTSRLEEWVGFRPSTPIEEGITKFSNWFINFYNK